MTKCSIFLHRRAVWWTLFGVWLVAVFFASSLTGSQVSPYIPTFFLHKLAHFIAYSSGAVILALSLRFSTQWSWRKIMVISVLVISFYGATDEWHQSFTPGRGPSVRDWLIDTVSGLIGVSVLLWLKEWIKKRLGLGTDINSGKP
jgi:VanZ family protein